MKRYDIRFINYHNLAEAVDAAKSLGYSQAKIAKRVGVSNSTISKWCSGECTPIEENFQKLLRVLNDIQKENGLEPYTIQYIRGDMECKTLSNQEIYNLIGLRDNAIQSLQSLAMKDQKENSSHLIPSDSVLTNVNIANFIISNEKMWNTLYAETKKALENILKEHSFQTTSYEDVISFIDTYKSDELNNTINTVFNDLIKDMLKYYYKKKEQ